MAQARVPFNVILMRQAFRLLGVFAPAVAANWAYRMWHSTRRFRESAHDTRWRKQARLQMLESRFGKIAVYHWGDETKPVVLCVHGWNGRASQFATMLPALLKADYQVVAFDAPGHGLSEGNSTNIFRISEVLSTIAGEYSTVQAIITHSFGGMVSAHAIKHHGISVQKLIMIASPVSMRNLIDMFAQAMAIDPRVMQRFDKMIRHESGDDVYDRISVEQNLRNSKLPILVIHDKNDTSVSWRNSERIVEVAANAAVIYTEGHGHRRLLRDKKLIKKMVSFIKTGAVVT